MRPISMHKREIIIAARQRGETVENIALWVNIAKSSVYKINRLYNETKTLEFKPFLGRPSTLTAEQLEKIKECVDKENDITLEELIEKLELPIKKSQLSKILIGMNFSFKKRHSTPMDKSEKMLFKSGQHGKKISRI